MRRKSRLLLASALGIGGIGGVAAAVVACGSTQPPPRGIYYSAVNSGTFSAIKSDKELFAFIPWNADASYAVKAKEFLLSGFRADVNGNISSGELSGYKLTFKYTDNANNKGSNTIGFGNTAAVTSLISSRDTNGMPDIVIAYPDVAAVFAASGILHDLGPGAATKVAEGFAADVNSIQLSDGSKPSFVLPFSKSSDGIGVNVVVMAKILSDIAALKDEKGLLIVPVDSDMDRMVRMILANSTETDLKMDNIYETNPSTPDSAGMVSYEWSALKSKWTEKTSPGGIWELDKTAVDTNFVFKNTDEAKKLLLAIDFSFPIFGNYTDLGSFVSTLATAYSLNKKGDPADSTFILGYDSVTNAIYSHQYSTAGHSPDGFFMSTKPVTVNGQQKSGVIRYNLYDQEESKTFVAAVDWVSNLVRNGGVYLKGSSVTYGSNLLQKHKLLISIGSTNGFSSYISKDDKPTALFKSENVNVGEVYYSLQPSKVSRSETKSSIINQGPSIFVVDIHGKDTGTKVASALLGAYQSGAKIENGKDTGYWNSSGYLYGNKASYDASSGFSAFLDNQTKNPTGWSYNIGKKLLLDYLNKVTKEPAKFDLYTNPVDEHTAEVRTNLESIYSSYFVNYFQDKNLGMPSGDEVAQRIVTLGRSNGWLKKADDKPATASA